jgi:hypothetical protein
MKFVQRVFVIAGIYGVVTLIPQYFMEARTGRDFPPAITHPEFFYGFIGVALAWQVMFFIIARDPQRYRAAMLPSALEKVGFGCAAVGLYLQGRLAFLMFGAGILDLVFATLFLVAYRRTAA